MCLLLFHYHSCPGYELILAANRDEFYDRPTAPLGFWPDQPGVLAGRDLKGGGTWMGFTRNGRMAALTNYRDPALVSPDAPSRGDLVRNYLISTMEPGDYLRELLPSAGQYNGFNLLVGDRESLWWYSNQGEGPRRLDPGLYGLSNHLLNTAWPKVRKGKEKLATLAQTDNPEDPGPLMEVLQDAVPPPDDQLPDTGVGLEWERMLSPLFIQSPVYGTRCSQVVTISTSGRLRFTERTYPAPGTDVTEPRERHFEIEL